MNLSKNEKVFIARRNQHARAASKHARGRCTYDGQITVQGAFGGRLKSARKGA